MKRRDFVKTTAAGVAAAAAPPHCRRTAAEPAALEVDAPFVRPPPGARPAWCRT